MTVVREVQRIWHNPWLLPLWVILVAALVVAWLTAANGPEERGVLIATLALVGVLLTVQLRTSFDGRQVLLFYWPIWRRTIAREDIVAAKEVTYRPIGDYLGWGIRSGVTRRFRGVFAYTVTGRHGILLTLQDGKQVLLGTRKPREWRLAFEAVGIPDEPITPGP